MRILPLLFVGLLTAVPARSQEQTLPEAAPRDNALTLAVVREESPPVQPVSPLDDVVTDEGLAGARLGLADDLTTARFTGQHFSLVERTFPRGADPSGVVRSLAQDGVRFIVAVAGAPAVRAMAQAGSGTGVLVLNAQAPDDSLRNEDCAANLLHTVPSRAQVADGLAQYLALKRWSRWFLVVGRHPGDKLLAEAFRKAAQKFGSEVVAEKEWTFQPGSARTDTGHVALQTEIPAFTQGADYDVLVVADETDEFGDDLPGRTARPRPVAGTQGIAAAGWNQVTQEWGATQLQNRFLKLARRRMTAVDYAAWAAVRAVGEAAIRAGSVDPEKVAAFMRGPDFLLAGFKGQGQSFRAWDGQMRQPILIAGPRLLVSVAPEPGFLHRTSELDTLGQDREESRCKP